jgi:hypothetical protein
MAKAAGNRYSLCLKVTAPIFDSRWEKRAAISGAVIFGEEQKYIEEKFFPYIGEVLTHDEFLKKLE